MPTANNRKPRLASYFEDDDVDEPRAAIARTRSSAARSRFGPSMGIIINGVETDQDQEHEHGHDHTKHGHKATEDHGERIVIHETHHEKTEPHTDAKKPQVGKKAIKKALRDTIQQQIQQLHVQLKKSDTLLDGYVGRHKEAIKNMLRHRDACIQIRDEADDHFLQKHAKEEKENSEAFKVKRKLPHPNLRKDRVTVVHSMTYKFTTIHELARELQAIVDEYGSKEHRVTCPKPIPVEGKEHMYYVWSVIHYMRREKYRVVEALLNHLRHVPAESLSQWQKEFMHNSHEITTIKKKIAETRQTLRGIHTTKLQKKRERKPRERWDLPDRESLPKQMPWDDARHVGRTAPAA